MDRVPERVEQEAEIAVRRQRMLDMLEGRKTMPHSFFMPCWMWKGSCGTSACAFGNYIEAYPDCGLSLVQGWHAGEYWPAVNDRQHAHPLTLAAEHFGLSRLQAHNCFTPEGYDADKCDITPAMVAEHFREACGL